MTSAPTWFETAEKGAMWLRLRVEGTAGHGSMLTTDNPVAKLAAAITRLDAHRFPLVLTDPVREFLAGVGELTGVPFDESDPEGAVARLGSMSRLIGATLRDTATVTMFKAGYKTNVVPGVATATVHGRMLPGRGIYRLSISVLRETRVVPGHGFHVENDAGGRFRTRPGCRECSRPCRVPTCAMPRTRWRGSPSASSAPVDVRCGDSTTGTSPDGAYLSTHRDHQASRR